MIQTWNCKLETWKFWQRYSLTCFYLFWQWLQAKSKLSHPQFPCRQVHILMHIHIHYCRFGDRFMFYALISNMMGSISQGCTWINLRTRKCRYEESFETDSFTTFTISLHQKCINCIGKINYGKSYNALWLRPLIMIP